MKYLYPLLLILPAVAACSDREADLLTPAEPQALRLMTDVVPFSGGDESGTRSSIDGLGFEDGDWLRLKVICPFSPNSEWGESTYGGSTDSFFLMKRQGGAWKYLAASDSCDIDGNGSPSASPVLDGYTEAQQTPYVYMASTWSEEKVFRTNDDRSILQYCHVFHADQRKAQDYKASDLLWGQQYMQTGSWDVHISLQHVMACLTIEVESDGITPALTDAAVLTLEGMPDIDQQEIIVGDYYAPRSKNNSGDYGYRSRNSCLYEYNGKVIGIGVNLDKGVTAFGQSSARAYAVPMTGNPNPAYNIPYTDEHHIPNTGTYTAYKVDNRHYRMIVPPCVLADYPQFWLRDGERRYQMSLLQKSFHEGELYPVKITLHQ